MVIRQNWFDVQGDDTLALDWNLNEDSLVWEIGGFEGRWAKQIWDKFHCHITIFEPQDWAVKKLIERFGGIKKIDIRPYGLWVTDEKLKMDKYFTDGATIVSSYPEPSYYDEDRPVVEFRSITREIINEQSRVDVCLMNIEGAEWKLIPELLKFNLTGKFRHFWCQFHRKGWDEESLNAMRSNVFTGMERTHEMLWDCYPTAVAWRKR